MKPKQLFSIIDIMIDNMMSDVSSSDQEEENISKFRTWISLSFIGGLIETEDYELIRHYGESKIEEKFKEIKKWERWQNE